jgi:hypothetical protein
MEEYKRRANSFSWLLGSSCELKMKNDLFNFQERKRNAWVPRMRNGYPIYRQRNVT